MNFRESYFHNEFGLSCVEDYIIYILCKDTINWARIFFKSYVDIEEIINYLFLEGQEYSSIKFIERIQDTLIQNGMLNLVPLELKNVENIEKKLVFLMELKDGATRELLNINTWRNDHFIMVYKDVDDKYSYVNDRPYLTGNLEYKDLLKYAGKEYVLDIRIINNDIAAAVNEESLFRLEQKLNSQSILTHNVCFECEKIRDCIGIYRVVVKRLQAFFGSYGISEFMRDEIEMIERIYLRLEYMNLRRNYDIEKINALIDEAICIQKKIKKKALERMEIIYEQCRRESY